MAYNNNITRNCACSNYFCGFSPPSTTAATATLWRRWCSFKYSSSSGSYYPHASYRAAVLVSSVANGRRVTPPSQNSLIFEAVRLLGPPARFEPSKLKVDFKGEEIVDESPRIIPRIYTLSHCDFTANLTLTVSNIISINQLQGWYCKDDVVAEWKEVKGNMCLHVHCYVSGPYPLRNLAAEFRYHIFSKELPLVLQAVLHGDSALFEQNPNLMESVVWVYFHSSSAKYNRVECWGPLKDAAQGQQEGRFSSILGTNRKGSSPAPTTKQSGLTSKSFFQALFTFLL